MKLPKPKSTRTSAEKHFIPLTIDGYNYTVVICCLAGYPQTMEQPGEPSTIEIDRVFDANGVDISKEVSDKDWEELDEWFNNPLEKSTISLRKVKMGIESIQSKLFETPVIEFELSVRALNCLKMADIKTFGELINISREQIIKLVGKKTMKELDALLLSHGRNWNTLNHNKK